MDTFTSSRYDFMNIEMFERLCAEKIDEYIAIATAHTSSSNDHLGNKVQYFHDLTAKMMRELREQVDKYVREEGMREDLLVAIVQKHFGDYFEKMAKLSVDEFGKPHQ